LTKQLDYNVDSFQPIVLYNLDPHFLVVPADSPFKTLDDFVTAAKAGTITVATPGHSTANHTSGLLLEKELGANFKFIHTKGAPEQIPMIAGSHAQSGIASWGEIRSMVEQGKVRTLGILAEKRDPRAPKVATLKEQGINLAYGSWRGIAAPKGTPPEVVDILSQSFQKAIESKEVKDRFAQSGFPLIFMGPDEFGKHMKTELDNMSKILSLLKK
jgi:tripartite-type tricarboxylate transporter receptor subunit TctC